jgi:acyl-CoA synthetase (AMP-forming)/AMP-acid ligase II
MIANDWRNTMSNGARYGDRVGLLCPERTGASTRLGKIAILVPINHRLAGPEIQYILSDCEAKVFVFGREFSAVVDSIRKDIPAKERIAISDDPPKWAKSYEGVTGDASAEEPEEAGADDN